jgi:hypothetical protein
MSFAPRPNIPGLRIIAPWIALAALCGLTACMETDAGSGPPADAATATPALQEKAVGKPGVPVGCTREWSNAARDSVLNCPDVAPPSPR